MSGGGGSTDNSEQVEKQYQHDMDAYHYGNAHAERMRNDAVLNNAIRRNQLEQEALYKEQSQAQQWDYQMDVRQFQFDSKVAAYNKAEKMYGAQIGLNQRAAGLAYDNALNVKEERQNKLAFEIAQSGFKFEQAIQGKTLEHQGKRAGAAFTSQDNFVKSIQAKGAALATGQTGRSANKRYQAITAEAGRAQAAMIDGLTRADSAHNLAMYGIESDYTMQRWQQNKSALSIVKAYEHQTSKVEFDHFAANVKADANRMSMPTPPPAIPKPLAIPRAIVTDPPLVVYGPEPIEGAIVTTGTRSTGLGSVIGMVAGAAIGSMIPGGTMIGASIGSSLGGGVEAMTM